MGLIEVESRGEVALVRVCGGKANAMGTALLDELGAAAAAVGASDAGAAVITGYDAFFSAGLALPELVDLDRAAMRRFIDGFGDAMGRVLGLDLPVVAAINGHAIAGGCVLALQCDVRLMAAGSARIGLNEVQLGIGLPAVVTEPLRLKVPASSLAPIALEGRLFDPDQARAVGLVDEVVPAGELIDRAVARAAELGRAPRGAFAQVKAALLAPVVAAIAARAEVERERWLDTWFAPAGQERLRAAVARLRGGGRAG